MQSAGQVDAVQADADQWFMQAALAAARTAVTVDEVPVGAVLVRAVEIIGSAHNAPIMLNDPTAHAEVLALRQAAYHLGNYRLTGATLFVTVEPCVMCVGAMLQARIERVVFGCAEPRAGALGSAYDLGRDARGNHRLLISGGVCAQEARVLLRNFFRVRRGA